MSWCTFLICKKERIKERIKWGKIRQPNSCGIFFIYSQFHPIYYHALMGRTKGPTVLECLKLEYMQFHLEAGCHGLFKLLAGFWCKSSGWQGSRDGSSYSQDGLRPNHLSQILKGNDRWIVVESCWHDKCLCISFSLSAETSASSKSHLALA